MRRGAAPARNRAMLMAVLVVAQVALGIATLVQVVPIGLALPHQAMALILLLDAGVERRASSAASRLVRQREERGVGRADFSPSIATRSPMTFARPLATSFSASG